MDTNTMKKMVVLKGLHSNLVEEAYVIFKSNVKIHKLQKIDNEKNINQKANEEKIIEKDKKDYIIKEAEFVVDDYISKLENKYYRTSSIFLKQNYIRLKILIVSISLFSLLDFVLLLLK